MTKIQKIDRLLRTSFFVKSCAHLGTKTALRRMLLKEYSAKAIGEMYDNSVKKK